MAQSTPPAPPGSEVSIQDSVFDDLRGPDIVSWGESVNNEAGTNKIGCSPPPTTSPGSKAKRCTRLKGEKRSQETQDNRNNGVCRPCRKNKQGCTRYNPNNPYGPCVLCVNRYLREKRRRRVSLNFGEEHLAACQRTFRGLSELLQPYTERRDSLGQLYLKCIQIGPILGFLDRVTTGDPSPGLTPLRSLWICMVLATIHKFCRRRLPGGEPTSSPEDELVSSMDRTTLDRNYRHFFNMALFYWRAACECLRVACIRSMNAELWRRAVELVATAFAIHLNNGVPQGISDTDVLKEDLANDIDKLHRTKWLVVQLSWREPENQGLFSPEEDVKVPIHLRPDFVTTIEDSLCGLFKDLKIESRRNPD